MDIHTTISTNPRYSLSMFKDCNMPVHDFAEYTAEKMGFPDKEAYLEYIRNNRELAVKNNSENNIRSKVAAGKNGNVQFADFSKVYRFESTGDLEYDKKLEKMFEYYDSCMDFSNAKDYGEMTANEDFSGMSEAEIYKAIYEKYQHCYGENFLEASAIVYGKESPIVMRFNNEINKNCGKYYEYKVQNIRRELLYGNANAHDVRQRILDKYTENGNITMRNLFKANNEMNLCGVGCGFGADNILMDIESSTDNAFDYDKENHFALRMTNLDSYVTSSALKKMAKTVESRINSGYISSSANAVVSQIIEACGGGYGSIRQIGINIEKMASNSERARASLTWLKPQKA